jgi:MFS family permease
MRALLPASARPDAGRLVLARALRGLADGFLSVVLAAHLAALGLSDLEVGGLLTATLVGSALLTLAVGLRAERLGARPVLLAAAGLMAATGAGFAGITAFLPLLVVAFVGTLNPTGGDVSVFLPTEQALLASACAPQDRTALFARYNVAGALFGAAGSLASALPELAARALGFDLASALRASFLAYVAIAAALALLYRSLSTTPTAVVPERTSAAPASGRPARARPRRVVLELTALFSLDSFGGGFVVQSFLALWLLRRFGLSLAEAGAFFFAANLLAAASQLLSAPLARRIGLVPTMVWTHLPADLALVAAALAPAVEPALALLLLRASISQMDVAPRQSLVMSLVAPAERAAAASVTNVPRSLATALAPLFAGWLLQAGSLAAPLILAGVLKSLYDVLLWLRFGSLAAPADGDDAAAPNR